MPRFLISPDHIQGDRFLLTGSEAHHALRVLRKKVGDTLELFDGRDLSFTGKITAVTDSELHGVLVATGAGAKVSVELVLCQGLLKGPKWDWLIEKAAELGVSRLQPLLSKRTVVQWKNDSEDKRARWDRIALAASKQCGRKSQMEIAQPFPAAELWDRRPAQAPGLIPWEKESRVSVAEALQGVSPKEVWMFVGPEGGWETEEVEAARRAGVVPVKLGPTLLRSETAGLVAATLAYAALGDY